LDFHVQSLVAFANQKTVPVDLGITSGSKKTPHLAWKKEKVPNPRMTGLEECKIIR
jgi:hypothetical protein